MSIIGQIQDAMVCDDEDQSDRLERLYEHSDEAGKALIDAALICICGYSIPTLRERDSACEVES